MNETDSKSKSPAMTARLIGKRCLDWLSGFGLATSLLLLMGLLTWFATLEQIDIGLHATLKKYFSWESWYLIPEINGKMVGIPLYCDAELLGMHFNWSFTIPGTELDTIPLVLPSGYWVGALLLINLILGGVVRARKGWSQAGNLVAHSGIILMLVAGGVAHHFEERGNMAIEPGDMNDAAQDYHEHVVEILELDEAGEIGTIHVIRGEHIMDLTEGRSRIIRLPDLPFDLQLAGYVENGYPRHQHERAPRLKERVVDGYYIEELEPKTQAELNHGAIYGRMIHSDGNKGAPFILSGLSFYPHTLEHEGKLYAVQMRKRLWPMPFALRLDDFTAEFHPGTRRPSKFVSEVTRIEGDARSQATIRMNQPLRYGGLTFYQASYGPQDAGPEDEMYTVLEVVSNPADKWPEYALYIVTVGLLVAFIIKLTVFLNRQSRKRAS
ncbi:MAG: cytochrome c biogenesis protein ResB [Akkermansiaceae bacterium]|nr:cytochrome c biogenesis protein ResB [Akkermansiaceae bacterium]